MKIPKGGSIHWRPALTNVEVKILEGGWFGEFFHPMWRVSVRLIL